MIALVQRVSSASVRVDGQTVGAVGRGLLVLLGVVQGDTPAEAEWLADKAARLRVFPDADGRMNRSLEDVGGGALVVSQFTLAGDVRKGTRPSYARAAPPDVAEPLYEAFAAALAERLEGPVATGVFGAKMEVALVNDGPVTLWLERAPSGGEGP
jgi:D-tyrosyl-tRNA(Tyr) deacylase